MNYTASDASPALAGRARLARAALACAPLAIIALAYARTLAPGITWANDGADSGDLVTAAATLGVAHPTGYPSYILLAWLFQFLPIGDLAWRTTLLSAVAGLLAALVAGRITRALAGDSWAAHIGGAFTTLMLGLSPVFWSQSIIAEVYIPNALFVALAIWFALGELLRETPAAAWRRGQALLVGLGLGVHITGGLVAALWYTAGAAADLRAGHRWRLAERTLWAAAGLLVYLYLPLRAAAHPPINWGDPHDLAGFWWVVSGQLYRPLAFGLPAAELGGRVQAAGTLLHEQFGIGGLLLAVVGLLYGRARSQVFLWLSTGVALIYAAFAVAYNTNDSYPYLIPSFLVVAIWLGLGVRVALEWLGRWRGAPAVAALALLIWAGWHAIIALPALDASADRRAIAFAERVLAEAPPNAIIAAGSDLDAFPLWYYHYALRQRRDTAVLVDPLLDFEWYRSNLRAVYPTLVLPEAPAADAGWLTIVANNNPGRPLCHTDPEGQQPVQCTP